MDYTELAESLRYYATHVPNLSASFYAHLLQAADAIEKLANWWSMAKTLGDMVMPKWIPVTERLPEEEESVLVVRKFLGIKGKVPPSRYTEIAYRIGDIWLADSDEYKIARHRHTDPLYWMPLPEPPKEENNG